jgi:hypothetical protein
MTRRKRRKLQLQIIVRKAERDGLGLAPTPEARDRQGEPTAAAPACRDTAA